jgi:undecaprenyl diphosphate synthase
MNNGIDIQNLFPSHVAFIMDGNRRWAKKNNFPIIDGHKKGAEVIKKIVRKSIKLNIKYLTFYGFSTENWNRSKDEVVQLQSLLKLYLDSETDNFIKNKINFSFIGDIRNFDSHIREKLNNLKKITNDFNKLFFTLALGYGSRCEILGAINKILKKRIQTNITEKNISDNLMTSHLPEPDLVIRTSGEKRLSNFLLWQIAYSELYFTKTQWPDFNVNRYMIALKNFVNRKRRYGGD